MNKKTIELKARYALGDKVYLCRMGADTPPVARVSGPWVVRDILVSVKTEEVQYQLEMLSCHATRNEVPEVDVSDVEELSRFIPRLLDKLPSKPVKKAKYNTSYIDEEDDEGEGYLEEDE